MADFAAASVYRRQYVAFFLIGLINNGIYCLILAASRQIALIFHDEHGMGAITGSCVILGTAVRLLTLRITIHTITMRKRMAALSMMMVSAMAGLAAAIQYANLGTRMMFAGTLMSILAIGAQNSLGETFILAWMKNFDKKLIGAWGVGTGAAGVLGTASYVVLFGVCGMNTQMVIVLMMPLALVYWKSYCTLEASLENKNDEVTMCTKQEDDEQLLERTPEADTNRLGRKRSYNYIAVQPVHEIDMQSRRQMGSVKHVWHVGNMVKGAFFNLYLVYLFEYLAMTTFANRAVDSAAENSWWNSHYYELLSFIYMCGVAISRSSLPMIILSNVTPLTAIQAVNCVLWLAQAQWRLVDSPVVLCAFMLFVGLLGGASYIALFFSLLSRSQELGSDFELASNIVNLAVNLGILSSACCQLLLDNFWF